MDFSHDRMVIDHSIVVSIAKLSMLTSDLPERSEVNHLVNHHSIMTKIHFISK